MTSLHLGGECATRELELGSAELAAVPDRHQVPDVSELLEDRRGAAVRFAGLAELVEPTAEAAFVHVASEDGEFTASLPLEQVMEQALVLYALDGEPLPARFGGPFRMLLVDGSDCSVNVKFLHEVCFAATPGRHTAACAD